MLAEYLSGLGFVRQNLITARDVLNAEGKKKLFIGMVDAGVRMN